MGCATGIVKYLVFLANLIFALAGLALVAIGVLYKLKLHDATDALPSNLGVAPVLSIVIGAIVFITAFLGCCGAVKESSCMLTTYAIILLVIFIIQVAIGVYVFIKINQDENEFRREIRQALQKPFEHYKDNNENREAVDTIQTYLQCCSFNNYHEMELANGQLVGSCCQNSVYPCTTTSPNFHDKYCFDAVQQFVQNSSNVIAGVAIGIAVIEILGAIFGLCLSSSIRNHYRRNIYT